jgi:hypothetical protein
MPRQLDEEEKVEAGEIRHTAGDGERVLVERVQTGVRMEKRLVKVLKALAELYDMSLGDLLEGIVLHAFDGRVPFSEDSLRRIAELKRIYGLTLDSRASHRLIERAAAP